MTQRNINHIIKPRFGKIASYVEDLWIFDLMDKLQVLAVYEQSNGDAARKKKGFYNFI